MILAIDIGNTNIAFGLFKGKRLLKKMRLPTYSIGTGKSSSQKIKTFLKYDIDAIVICSVVPKAERLLVSILEKLFCIKPLVLGKDFNVPIRNLYKKPKQVGQDRLVNAYAGYTFYKAPLIIIDFGTAITFDVVSETGAYLGGIIAPGIELALNALSEKTALLPKIKPRKVTSILGRTTSGSMLSSITYGFGSMCDGLVAKLRKKTGLKFNVIATGGDARLISRYSASIEKIDENLTLKGINLVYQALIKSPEKS
jgi:type III pantothenate kinase